MNTRQDFDSRAFLAEGSKPDHYITHDGVELHLRDIQVRLIAGDVLPESGQVLFHGASAQERPQDHRAQVFWRDPRAPWPDTLTPLTWVEQLPAHHPRWSGEAWRAHVAGFGLAMHLHKPMYQLSSGSQRKVLLAAALASGAVLTLLDEPLAALDKPSISYLLQALEAEARAPRWPGRAVLVAHYDALGDLPWCARIAL